MEKWHERPSVRNRMIEDLKENHNLIGMKKDQVVMLLGEPDEIAEEGNLFYYYYDIYGKISIFFKNNAVANVEVYAN